MGIDLRTARTRKGWTTSTLATKAGIADSTVSRYENGRREPTYRVVRALEAALGLKPGQLVFDARAETPARVA